MKVYWPHLTILGRSVTLITVLILFNASCWVVAALLFGKRTNGNGDSIISLAMLAWTIGFRHALDADHISAIDNATRGLINLGQLPVTCGLFFSLGHSTIVVVFIIAIAISTDIYDRVGGFSEVGEIIGASVSGSFLFIIGVVNSVILYRIIRDRRNGNKSASLNKGDGPKHTTVIMRILSPVTRIVDRPWKMYPVGVLFGLGFDTASSIALLAISAIAKRNAEGKGVHSASVVILPFLFTAGMTLVDSLDSILMLYSYAGLPERGWKLIRVEKRGKGKGPLVATPPNLETSSPTDGPSKSGSKTSLVPNTNQAPSATAEAPFIEDEDAKGREETMRLKNASMSTLSILLTFISILLAFTISLITIMSLIGEQCAPCREAAEADEGTGGGLAGQWWRGWSRAADASGYIGAGMVGGFVVVVSLWYLARYVLRRVNKARSGREELSV